MCQLDLLGSGNAVSDESHYTRIKSESTDSSYNSIIKGSMCNICPVVYRLIACCIDKGKCRSFTLVVF